MIRQQVLRDPFFKPLVLSVMLGCVMAGFMLLTSGSDSGASRLPQILVICFPIVTLSNLMSSKTLKQRFSEFWLNLPIPAKSLSRVRFSLLLAASTAPFLVGWILLALFLPSEIPESLNAHYWGGMGAMGLAIATHDIRCHGRNDLRLRDFFFTGLVMVVGLLSTLVLADLRFSLSLAGLSAVAVVYAWASTPDRIERSTEDSRPAKLSTTAADAKSLVARPGIYGVGTSLLLQATLLNRAWYGLTAIILFLVILPLSMGGAFFMFLPWAATNLQRMNSVHLDVLHQMAHLPISRRGLAPMVVLLPLVIGLLGIAAAVSAGITSRPGYPSQVRLQARRVSLDGVQSFYTEVQVPNTLWKIHAGSGNPVVHLAAGDSYPAEQFELTTYRPVPFLPLAVYNPYEVRPDCSIDFVAMQLVRAVEQGHGLSLDAEDVKNDYLEVRADGNVGRHFHTGEDAKPSLDALVRSQELTIQSGHVWASALSFLVMWSLVGLVSFRRRQFPRGPKTAAYCIVGGATLVLASAILLSWTREKGGNFLGALWRLVGAQFPEDNMTAAVLLLAMCSVPALYLMNNFTKMDVPVRSGLTLVRTRK